MIAILVYLWIFPVKPTDAATGVALNSTNFPNANFRTYLKNSFDTNKDNKLSAAEIEEIGYVFVSYMEIDTLKGVEYLTSLVGLDCCGNNLTELDVSSNTELVELFCSENEIETLNLSNNKQLEYLFCQNNSLSSLKLTNNTKLINVYCEENELTTLTINNCKLLEILNCSGNKLKSLNVSNLSNLKFLYCENNQLTTLTLGSKTNLCWLTCYGNNLSSLDVTQCPKILETMEKGDREEIQDVIRYTYDFGEDEYFLQFDASVSLSSYPQINKQPEDVIALAGQSATFSITATGGTLSYQWQVSKDNGATWKNIDTTKYPSAATKQLTFSVTSSMQGYQYRCKVKNSEGTTTSSAAVLIVSNAKPKITSQPANKTVTAGKTAKFTVAVVGDGVTYQWQVSKDGGSTWTNLDTTKYPSAATKSLSFTATAKMSGYKYRCVVKNSYGSVNSSAAKLTVN